MYGVAYQHPEGFGSVGFLGNFQRGGKQIRVGDPVFGWLTVDADKCFAVIETEGGSVLPAVSPALSSTIMSPWLLPRAEKDLVANPDALPSIWLTGRETGEKFPSGYPLAWKYIERWRTKVAPDWRTIALAAMFARFSLQRSIEEAEELYRIFGPMIRDALLADQPPTKPEMRRMKGIAGTRAQRAKAKGLDDVRSFEAIFEWAPFVAERMRSTTAQYDRRFRDMLGVEWVPWGLATAKLSFTMMLTGRDAACIDTRMEQYFFKEDESAIETFRDASTRRSKTAGARGLTPHAVQLYRSIEDKLARTEFFDPEWPMPFAKAQWMLWETLGRTAGTASHSALWEVLQPMLDEAGTT